MARREEREYREYATDEQRSQPGCIAARMQTNFRDAALAPLTHATLDEASVFCFKDGQAGVEQVAVGDDDDVEPGSDLVATENLSYQSFGSVSPDRAAKLFRRRDTQTPDPTIVCENERRAVSPAKPNAALVHALELDAAADPFG